MKILLTNSGPWGTGSFTIVKALANEFINLGHQVKIFFPDCDIPSPNFNEYYNNAVLYDIWKFPIKEEKTLLESFPLMIPDSNPRNPFGKTFCQFSSKEKIFYKKQLKKELQRAISSFTPDIIECQHIWLFPYILQQLGYKYICNALHSDQLAYLYDKKMQPLLKKTAKEASLIFTISQFVKKEVLSLYNVDEKKIVVQHSGYDKNVFKSISLDKKTVYKKLGISLPSDAKIITFAGSLSKTKGIDILLQSNKILCKEKNIHFLLFGSGEIEKIIGKSPKNNFCFHNMHFLGHHSPHILAQAFNISDIFVLPSRSEGFGIACLEAMACGTPVISTKGNGPEEFSIGKIISKEDPYALANAIKEILSLPKKKYFLLRKKAQKQAETFSWKKIAQERLDYYSKIVHKKSKIK